MSLKHILLGLLEEPASGYDLKRAFEQQQAHYWSANLAQIYPTLSRMERDGLLSSHKEASTRGPPRRMYARTEAGFEALAGWLDGGPEVQADRLTWLAQVGFLAALPEARRRSFLQSLKRRFESRRAELERVEAQWRSEDPRFPDDLPDPELFSHFTLRLGLLKYATIVSWCDECLSRLASRRPAASTDENPTRCRNTL